MRCMERPARLDDENIVAGGGGGGGGVLEDIIEDGTRGGVDEVHIDSAGSPKAATWSVNTGICGISPPASRGRA